MWRVDPPGGQRAGPAGAGAVSLLPAARSPPSTAPPPPAAGPTLTGSRRGHSEGPLLRRGRGTRAGKERAALTQGGAAQERRPRLGEIGPRDGVPACPAHGSPTPAPGLPPTPAGQGRAVDTAAADRAEAAGAHTPRNDGGPWRPSPTLVFPTSLRDQREHVPWALAENRGNCLTPQLPGAALPAEQELLPQI